MSKCVSVSLCPKVYAMLYSTYSLSNLMHEVQTIFKTCDHPSRSERPIAYTMERRNRHGTHSDMCVLLNGHVPARRC